MLFGTCVQCSADSSCGLYASLSIVVRAYILCRLDVLLRENAAIVSMPSGFEKVLFLGNQRRAGWRGRCSF